jgi:hypothetical protein
MSDDKSHIRNTQQPYNKIKLKQPNHVHPEKFKKIVEVKMSDQDSRIKNNQQPYNQERAKEPERVDPEKFKKIMEVQDTDDSQKQHKRPLKEIEEDESDEVTDSSMKNPEEGRFASLMNPESTSSIFDPSGDGVQYMNDDGQAPRTNMDDDVDLMAEPPITEQSQGQSSLSANDLDVSGSSANSSSAGFEASGPLPDINQTPETVSDMLNTPNLSSEDKNMDIPDMQPQTSSMSSDQDSAPPPPNTNNVDGPTNSQNESSSQNSGQDSSSKNTKGVAKKKAAKKAGNVKKAGKKVITKTVSKETKVDKAKTHEHVKTADKKVEPQTQKKPSSFTPFDPKKQANLEGMPTQGQQGGGSEGEQKKHDKHHDETMGPIHREPSLDTVGITNDFSGVQEVHTPAEASPLPAVSHLSPQMYDLFEQMAGVIMIQHSSGQTTTTVTINMKGSIFDGSEVVFNQYQTAPQSYNLELKGSPEAVKMFSENIPLLDASFKEAGFKFDVNILSPSLSKKGSSRRVKRKSGSEDKKDKK